jgi:hypothetical protein
MPAAHFPAIARSGYTPHAARAAMAGDTHTDVPGGAAAGMGTLPDHVATTT